MQPYIVLIKTQLPENLGSTARVMANFGLDRLRLVDPLCACDDSKAIAMATHGAFVLKNAKIFKTFEEAVGDCQYVIGTTCFERDMVKPYHTPRHFFEHQEDQGQMAIVFGPERTGLSNAVLTLCHSLITIPCEDHFSMNLSHAVSIIAYEWYIHFKQGEPTKIRTGQSHLATHLQLNTFFNILENQLDTSGYFRVASKKSKMWQNLRNIFMRAHLTDQDVGTLLGLVDVLKRH